MQAFQQPLSSSEEKEYLQKYRDGDLEARRILIERNLRLVAHVIKKYPCSSEDSEDLISIGTIGLIKAISSFNPDKSTRLSTYAAKCIDNELLMMFRARKKYSRDISLHEPIGTDKEGNEIHLLDIMESPPVDIIENCFLQEKIACLLPALSKLLTHKEYQVILHRYGLYGKKELTQRELSARLGISRSYVSRIEKSALLKLRKFLENR